MKGRIRRRGRKAKRDRGRGRKEARSTREERGRRWGEGGCEMMR